MGIVILLLVGAFLSGSIPTGYLIIKKKLGIDIREQGSGNIGSTNVKRVAGKKISIMTQIIDIAKGLIPVAISMIVASKVNLPIDKDLFSCMIALAAILGHDYTPFLGFNGGKGVNTTLGAYFLLSPIAILSGVLIYFLLRFVTKVVSIRSMALSITIPLVSFLMKVSTVVVIFTIIASALLIFRHKENIFRLIRNEEK